MRTCSSLAWLRILCRRARSQKRRLVFLWLSTAAQHLPIKALEFPRLHFLLADRNDFELVLLSVLVSNQA